MPNDVAANYHLAKKRRRNEGAVIQLNSDGWSVVRRCRYKLDHVVLDNQTPSLPEPPVITRRAAAGGIRRVWVSHQGVFECLVVRTRGNSEEPDERFVRQLAGRSR